MFPGNTESFMGENTALKPYSSRIGLATLKIVGWLSSNHRVTNPSVVFIHSNRSIQMVAPAAPRSSIRSLLTSLIFGLPVTVDLEGVNGTLTQAVRPIWEPHWVNNLRFGSSGASTYKREATTSPLITRAKDCPPDMSSEPGGNVLDISALPAASKTSLTDLLPVKKRVVS